MARVPSVMSARGRARVAIAGVTHAVAHMAAFASLYVCYLLFRSHLERLGASGGLPLAGTYNLQLAVAVAVALLAHALAFAATRGLVAREASDLRLSLAGRLRRLSSRFLGAHDAHDLAHTLLEDAGQVERAWVEVAGQLVGGALTWVALVVALLPVDARMTLASLWAAPVALFVAALALRSGTSARTRARDARAATDAAMDELATTTRQVRGTNSSAGFVARLDELAQAQGASELRASLFGAMADASAALVMRLGLATCLLFGAAYVANGSLDVLTFFLFLLAASHAYLPFDEALARLGDLASAQGARARLSSVLDAPVTLGDLVFEPQSCDVVFDHVSLAGDGDGRDALANVSFVAADGQVTALVGEEGSAARDVVRLMTRERDPREGAVWVGGVDASGVDPEALLGMYGVVAPETTLLNASVLENVRTGRPDATRAEVLKAAAAARCDAFVGRLGEGYDTLVGEFGAQLAPSEVTRVAIARAILKDAPVTLLFEEALAVEPGAATQVQGAASALLKGKTALVVATHARTVVEADRVVVLEGGTVVEQGAPAELLAQDGAFARMARLQAKAERDEDPLREAREAAEAAAAAAAAPPPVVEVVEEMTLEEAIAEQLAGVARGDRDAQERDAAVPVASSDEAAVYVGTLGKDLCYHREGCPNIRKERHILTLRDARAMGLKPCGFCKPHVSEDAG